MFRRVKKVNFGAEGGGQFVLVCFTLLLTLCNMNNAMNTTTHTKLNTVNNILVQQPNQQTKGQNKHPRTLR